MLMHNLDRDAAERPEDLAYVFRIILPGSL